MAYLDLPAPFMLSPGSVAGLASCCELVVDGCFNDLLLSLLLFISLLVCLGPPFLHSDLGLATLAPAVMPASDATSSV